MKVLPVIDLLHGKVVHAIAGNRTKYEPISSRLCSDGNATTLAENLASQYGFTHAYVADLNALQGDDPNWRSLKAIRGALPNLWVDAGMNHLPTLVSELPGVTPILSLESITSPDRAREVVSQLSNVVFSIDMKNRKLLTTVSAWRNESPAWLIDQVVSWGVTRLLLLDLATVGERRGPSTFPLIESTLIKHNVQIISGGGVRDHHDLIAFEQAGASFVLVATGLHFGNFEAQSLPKRYID